MDSRGVEPRTYLDTRGRSTNRANHPGSPGCGISLYPNKQDQPSSRLSSVPSICVCLGNRMVAADTAVGTRVGPGPTLPGTMRKSAFLRMVPGKIGPGPGCVSMAGNGKEVSQTL